MFMQELKELLGFSIDKRLTTNKLYKPISKEPAVIDRKGTISFSYLLALRF